MVTAVNRRIRRVIAAMWLSTTGGEDDRNGRSWRSPTPNPSKPSSSASSALETTSRNRSRVGAAAPVTGSALSVITVMARNFTRSLPAGRRAPAPP